MSPPIQPRVLAAMSGGVDSSVAAALLVEQGYEVIGVTLRLIPEPPGRSPFLPCCSLEAAQDAHKVAEQLGIPHRVLNYVDEFEDKVIADFIAEYRSGRTPNPCVRCNLFIKFGTLLEEAVALDAAYVATGHYARLVERDDRVALHKAVYHNKDQSYVLACLTQEQLRRSLFPVGNLSKEQTRQRAKSLGLVTADKLESQDICFVHDNDYRSFLTQRLGPQKPGPILTIRGEALGEHQGLVFYTIGQRKGLGISAPRPYYVVRMDMDQNALIVGHEEETYCLGLRTEHVNWCSIPPQMEPFDCRVKIRYAHTPAPARAIPMGKGLEVRFQAPQQSVTLGQWAVLYEDDYVLAGGIITESMPT